MFTYLLTIIYLYHCEWLSVRPMVDWAQSTDLLRLHNHNKHARSDPQLIQIDSEASARSGPCNSCPLACFWTQSIWPKPDTTTVSMPDLICNWSGSTQKHWPEVGPAILAHWLASGSNQFGQNLTQSARTLLDPRWLACLLGLHISWTKGARQRMFFKWKWKVFF